MPSIDKISAEPHPEFAVDFVLAHSHGDKRPYVQINVLGVTIMGLLDSGATHTILGSPGINLFQQLGLKIRKDTYSRCTVANGTRSNILGTVSIPIELEGRTRIIDAVAVPDVKHTIILGVDFWKQMGIIPDLATGTWYFHDEDNIVINEHSISGLSNSQQQELDGLLLEYSKQMGNEFGCTNMVEHTIETNSQPIKQRYYPVSPVVQRHIDKELDKMLKLGVVEPSNSGWSSPILLVPKKDKSYRFCVDFRKLNAVTKKTLTLYRIFQLF